MGMGAGSRSVSGNGNVLLGFSAGAYFTTESNMFVVDNQDRGNPSNETAKALLYGNFDADPLNQKLRVNGFLGVGVAATWRLSVGGGVNGYTQVSFIGGPTTLSFTPRSNFYEIASFIAGKGLSLSVSGFISAIAIKPTTGNVGIGTETPTSKLQVIGLAVYANNAAAIAAGLTAGAFYRTGADPDPVCVVH
jgi:hypothetical protein